MEIAAVKGAIRNRDVLAVLLGFTAFTLVLHGAWLVAVVYAFQQGGAAAAGTVALAVQGPAAISSPAVAAWFDRFDSRLALALSFGVQGVGLLGVAGAMMTDQHPYTIYALLACVAISQMSSRPTVSSMLPRVVLDPGELTAANSLTGTVETAGLIAGPALAGLLLFLSGNTAMSFAVFGALMLLGAVSALRIEAAKQTFSPDAAARQHVWAQVAEGVRVLRSETAPRNLVIVMAAMRLTAGVMEVGVVVIAIDHIGRSEASAGILSTAIGAGAIAGSALSFLLIGRRRFSWPIAIGVACTSVPLIIMAATTNFWMVMTLLAIAGVGRPIVEVSGRTLLQGLSNDDMLARIFGFLEGLALLVLAVGSALFSWLAVSLSIPTALVVCGLIPVLVTAMFFTRLQRIDAARPAVDPELLSVVRSTPLFSPLAPYRIEQMLPHLQRQDWMPGQTIFEKGDHGEGMFVVDKGCVNVDLNSLDYPVGLGRSDFFGEIAVLRRQPRMATVRAGGEGATTYHIQGDIFLDALATAPASQRRSERIVDERLSEA
jgi:MFS family permease